MLAVHMFNREAKAGNFTVHLEIDGLPVSCLMHLIVFHVVGHSRERTPGPVACNVVGGKHADAVLAALKSTGNPILHAVQGAAALLVQISCMLLQLPLHACKYSSSLYSSSLQSSSVKV